MRKRRYRIAELLGRGGFGSVYRAEKLGEEGFSTVVAIKLLHAVADSSNLELERMRADAVRRLRDEARLLGLLKHRAIVQVYDLERLRGEWAVVMEFVDGMHLGELVELTRVPVRQALAITDEVADGLHVAFHTKLQGRELGLLHRDIKPSNIMITAGGSVKVLDFGVARGNFEARESHTAGFLVGTQRYMSPEHLDFDDESFQVGPASDIYALGAVIFEILTGQPLGRASLERRSHEDRVARQLDEHLLGRVPKGLLSLLRRTLAFGPDERPTAIELRTACELLQQETPGESLRSWSERVVGAMIRQRREHHQPPADALVGTVVEEGSPGPAAPASHPTIAPAEPPVPAPAPARSAAPAAPVAPVPARAPRWRPPGAEHSAGAIGIDDADEAQVAALGANLSTLDESAEPVAGGLGISFEGDEPDLARPTRRRQAAAGDGSPRMPLYIAAGVGLLVVIGGGLWGISALLRQVEESTSTVETPPEEPATAPEAAMEAEPPAPGEPTAAAAPAPATVPAPAPTPAPRPVEAPAPVASPATAPQPAKPAPAAASTPKPAPAPAPAPEPTDHGAARAALIASLATGGAPAEPAPEPAAIPAESVTTSAVVEAVPALEPAPAERPPPPEPGSYKIVGNALEAFLKQGGSRFDQGAELPPGRYDIWAKFDRTVGAAPIRVGVVTIPAGTTVTLSCDADLTICRAI